MKAVRNILLAWLWLTLCPAAFGQTVVDIPTRPEVSQRLLVIPAASPRATVILLAGGHGGLGIFANGSFRWGEGNFLIRSRQMFAEQGLNVVIVDAPSDRQNAPYLAGFRQTAEHAADIKAVIAWARVQYPGPVWLVGTSRGTQSAAFIGTQLQGPDGPDGLVLTATILSDNKGRAVPAMALDKLRIPVLLVHHEQDGCSHCAYADIPGLQEKLRHLPRTGLLSFQGGANRGDPCEAYAHHGFNGLEKEVVAQIATWILSTEN
ncbi:alpha/beta hydrolase [Dechloromonas sp. ARDL1]|uniref:alpha/beta hydrolase n=1 Tax=Dechloromonas sp. ARDL1 TaxID=3322121 RepID=UPI003DA79A46